MTPGLERRDGRLHLRLMKGLVLSPFRALLLFAGIGLLFAIPEIWVNDLLPIQLTYMQEGLAFGFAAVGLNLLLRHTGLVSFGHAAFFGTGAYGVALVVDKLGIQSFVITVGTGTAVAIVMAMVIGAISMRYKGLYFALLTLAAGQLLWSIARGFSYFGGTDGLTNLDVSIFGLSLGTAEVRPSVVFWLSSIIVIVGMLVMYRIVRSPYGNALDAIGQNRTRARFIGIPVRRYVWSAFVISGIYGGIGGALYVVARKSIRPVNTLEVFVSGDILYMAILGGFGTLLGPLVGGLVFKNVQNLAADVSLPSPTGTFSGDGLIMGIIFIVVVFALPSGIVGSLKRGGVVRENLALAVREPRTVGGWFRAFPLGRGILAGLGAFAASYAAAFVLKGRQLGQLVDSFGAILGAPPGKTEAAGWLLAEMHGHRLDARVTTESDSYVKSLADLQPFEVARVAAGDATGTQLTTYTVDWFLLWVPVAVLFVAGYLVARSAGADGSLAGMRAGLTVCLGYAAAALALSTLTRFTASQGANSLAVGPDPVSFVVLIGLGYAAIVGALGGGLAGSPMGLGVLDGLRRLVTAPIRRVQ